MKRALETLRLNFQPQFSYLQAVEVTRRRLWLGALWLFLSLCLLLSARPASAAVTLLFEGFEGSFPEDNGWSVGNSNTNSPVYWDDVNSSFGGEATHIGNWKGYCAGSAYPFNSSEPNPTYQDNMTAYMRKSLDLTRYSSATLTFWYKIPSIESYDACQVKLMPNLCFGCPPGGWVLWTKNSAAAGWSQVTLDLTLYVGSICTLAFEFSSDYSVYYEGWYLDDISVTGTLSPDYFAGATPLSGTSGSVSGNNTGATSEPGEPANYGRTVWWRWTAPTTGCYVFDTYGSAFDTILDVYYGGDMLNSLVRVVHNDDWDGTLQSQVRFTAFAGDTYYVRVEGFGGAQGSISLNYAADTSAPANDNFAAATVISGSSGHTYGDNCNATSQAGEPPSLGHTVWWRWTAPSTGCFSFDTSESGFDTILEVFSGPTLTNLSLVAYNDGPLLSASQVSFHASAAATYYIRVDGGYVALADVRLEWYPDTSPPVNDNFASATVLGGVGQVNGTASGDNCNTSSEAGEPANRGRTVWWRWTAPNNAYYSFDTFYSGFNTVLEVFLGASVNNLTRVAYNDDWNGTLQSQVRFEARVGQTYYVRVDGFNGEQGQIQLSWSWELEAPANDNFSSATPISAASGSAFGNNYNATAQPGEPPNYGATVWWRWTAPASGCCVFDTAGSAARTAVDIYTGSTIGGLSHVAHNDFESSAISRVSFAATAGITYSIRVDGYGGDYQDIQINWARDSSLPANDNFASATPLSGGQGQVHAASCNATSEAGEPTNNGRTLWWGWVAPSSGCYIFHTGVFGTPAVSSFDTILEVFAGSALNNLSRLAYNDNYNGSPQSLVVLPARVGATYYLRVDGAGGQGGDVYLSWYLSSDPPANDDFSSANSLFGANGTESGFNCNATTQAGEPASAGGRTVWWAWTAYTNGNFVFDTLGSSFDTVLEVFTGDSLSGLRLLASNDDAAGSHQSQLQFQATAGVTYYIRVSGHGGDQGQVLLNWRLGTVSPPPMSPPRLRITRSGGNVIASWPLAPTGFMLQQRDDLGANSLWTPVSHSIAHTADEYVVTVPATKPKQFFRLAPYSAGALAYSRIDIDSPIAQAGAGFGSTVAVIGDVNGDGVADFAVGAPGQTVGGMSGAGSVFVFSGASGAFIRAIDNPAPAPGGCFGAAISFVADVTGDGVPDLVVGAPGQDRAYVFTNATAGLVRSFTPVGLSSGNQFGAAVAGLGTSIAVTAPLAQERGALFYFSATGATTGDPALVGEGAGRLGTALAFFNYVFLVGEPGFAAGGVNDSGIVRTFPPGQTFQSLQSPAPEVAAFFGTTMAVLGGNVVIGDHPSGGGTAFIFDGANGHVLRTLPKMGDFAGVGDVDGDGLPELLMVDGTNGARVLSLPAGGLPVELAKLDYPSTPRFLCYIGASAYAGVTVAGLGDVDNDGVPDLLAGSPGLTVGTNQTQGRVFLFLSGKTPAQP